MRTLWHTWEASIAAIGAIVGWLLGGNDGFLMTLVAFVTLDYITGVIAAYAHGQLSSAVGFKGIARKVVIFSLVGVANLIDVHVLGEASMLRTATIFFYLANEGLSILENAVRLGLPIPDKLKNALAAITTTSGKPAQADSNSIDRILDTSALASGPPSSPKPVSADSADQPHVPSTPQVDGTSISTTNQPNTTIDKEHNQS